MIVFSSYQEILEEINIEIHDLFRDYEISVELHSNGEMDVITFLGKELWNSEEDYRPYLDEENDTKVDLKLHIYRQVNNLLEKVSMVQIGEQGVHYA
jgi:hypothetical protein